MEPSKPRTITIGRDPSNTVVLSSDNVSSKHARLTISEDGIVLEDVGSTNGTSVGTVENKTRRAIVSESDSVFFGSSEYRVSELIKLAENSGQPVAPSVDAGGMTAAAQAQQSAASPVNFVIVVAVAFALSTGVFWGSFGGDLKEPANGSRGGDSSVSTTPVGEINRQDSSAEAGPSQSNNAVNAETAATEVATDEEKTVIPDSAQALFIVICRSKDTKTPFRVGTAFATDSGHVVTSASVIGAIQRLMENEFTSPSLYSPHLKQTFSIDEMDVHPGYDSVTGKIDALMEQPGQEKELIALFERRTAVDVGLLKVTDPPPNGLALHREHPRPGQKLQVLGYPFNVDDPFFDASISIPADKLNARSEPLRAISDSAPVALSARVMDNQMNTTEFAFIGSPVVNSQNEVVGIYARNRPKSSDNVQTTEQFDGTLIERLLEILTDE